MTTTLGLSHIHDILTRFEHTGDADQSAQAMRQMLLDISERLPAARHIRLYHLGHETALLRAATDDELPSGSFQIQIQSNKLFTQTLESGQPVHDRYNVWVAPLSASNSIFGLFEIGFEPDIEIDDALNEWLWFVARALSSALHAAAARDLLQRQAHAFAALTGRTNFRDMVDVIAKTMLSDGMMISINLMEMDDDGHASGVRTVARSNRYESIETDDLITFSYDERGDFIHATVDEATPRALYTITDNEALSPAMREWMHNQGIKSLHSFPMRRDDIVIGFLAVSKLTGPLYLDQHEILSYQSIADQISTLTQARYLADESQSSRDINARRTLAFNELSAEHDYGQMAQIIARHMLRLPGRYLAITLVRFNTDDVIEGLTVATTANRQQSYQWDQDVSFAWQGLGEALRKTMLDGAPVSMNDIENDTAKQFLGEAVHYWFTHDLNARAFANFPIMITGRPIAFLTIISRSTGNFSPDEMDAFHNLAEQMAALIHARSLLETAQEARIIADTLVHTSRLIVMSEDNQTLLTALLDVLPQNVGVLGLSMFEQPIVLGELPTRIDTEMVSTDEDVPQEPIIDSVPQDDPNLPDILTQFHNREVFISRIDADYRPVMVANVLHRLRELGIHEIASMGLHSGGRLWGVMFFGAADAILVGTQHTDNLRTIADQIAITLENRALLKQARQSTTELSERVNLLQTLQLMATTISTSQDRQLLLTQATQGLVDLLNIDHCSIMMLNADGVSGTIVAEYPDQPGTLGVQIEVEQDNPIYHDARELDTTTIVIRDVESSALVKEEDRDTLRSFGIKSLVIMPLIVQQKFIGSIGLDIMRPEVVFTADMLRIAEAIRTEVSLGLNKIDLLDSAQRYAQQMQYITAFGQSVQATLDKQLILRLVLEESRNMLPQDRMSITLHDRESDQLLVVARFIEGTMHIDLDQPDIGRTENTLLGHVWETKQLLYVPDQHIDADFPDMTTPFRSYMLMPIQTRDRIFGTVNIGAGPPNAYSETDIAVFVQMVNQLAVALENAELYAQSQQVAHNKALVNEITTQLQAQRDIDDMLNVTAKELGKALGAKRARIRLGPQHGENGG